MRFSVPQPGAVEAFGAEGPQADMEALNTKIFAYAEGRDVGSAKDLRAMDSDVTRNLIPSGPAVAKVTDIAIPGPGGPIPVRVYRPDNSNEPLPAVIWTHGGGMVVGSPQAEDGVSRTFAREARCVVYNVGYRLAPEHPFPAAYEDFREACRVILTEGPEGPIDKDRVAIGGVSAGASLSAAACLAAVNEGWGKPLFQLLVVPLLDWSGTRNPGREQSPMGRLFTSSYIPDGVDPRDERLSPFLAKDIAKLPPTFILTSEFDSLRQEGEEYGQRLHEAGVPTRVARVRGLPHVFFAHGETVANAKASIDLTCEVLREVLHG